MTASIYDFELEQGATSRKIIVWTDSNGTLRDLTGYSARMQIRQYVGSDVVLFELSTTNGKIVISPVDGEIALYFSAIDTEKMTWRRGKYDLELVSVSGEVTRLLQGKITISPEITRE